MSMQQLHFLHQQQQHQQQHQQLQQWQLQQQQLQQLQLQQGEPSTMHSGPKPKSTSKGRIVTVQVQTDHGKEILELHSDLHPYLPDLTAMVRHPELCPLAKAVSLEYVQGQRLEMVHDFDGANIAYRRASVKAHKLGQMVKQLGEAK